MAATKAQLANALKRLPKNAIVWGKSDQVGITVNTMAFPIVGLVKCSRREGASAQIVMSTTNGVVGKVNVEQVLQLLETVIDTETVSLVFEGAEGTNIAIRNTLEFPTATIEPYPISGNLQVTIWWA
jgi:hypothetical protein